MAEDEGSPRIELLWWRGCPSTDRALGELREEMSDLGLDPSAVVLEEVGTDSDARRRAFVGSPTIRVDGVDVQEPAQEPVGLTCRVYRLRDGRISALPDREDVRAALREAIERAADG